VAAALALVDGLPDDPWQRTHIDHASCDAHIACGQWAPARLVARRALATAMGSLPTWRSRLALLVTIAEVETALDAIARREEVDPVAVTAALEAEFAPGDDAILSGPLAADHAHRAAELSRLGPPRPDLWQTAAACWTALGDPYWTAVAQRHLAETAFATDDLTTAADALQDAHRTAVQLGAARLVADIDAFSRRSRLAVEAPRAPVLAAASVDRLGLTSREAEVLGLVAAGHTNRQIGERLYVSEKTASVHVSNILRKLGVTSRVDAAAIAHRLGVTN
jgi:DNA-binding CsgD family transcriptional regulator